MEQPKDNRSEPDRRSIAGFLPYLGDLPDAADPAVAAPYAAGRGSMAEYRWDQAVAEFRRAISHARGNQLAALHNLVGLCFSVSGPFDEALGAGRTAHELFRQAGNRAGEASALMTVGQVWKARGDRAKAYSSFEDALEIYRETGDRAGEAFALNASGSIAILQSFYGEEVLPEAGLKPHSDALAISRELGFRLGEAHSLACLGSAWLVNNDWAKSRQYYQEALDLFQSLGDRMNEANQLSNIGNIAMFQGDLDTGLKYYAEAVRAAQQTGFRLVEVPVLMNLGLVWKDKGDLDQAREHLLRALRLSLDARLTQMTEFAVRNLYGVYYTADCLKNGLSLEEAKKLHEDFSKAPHRNRRPRLQP